MQSNRKVEPLYRTNIILWFAFLMSQFVFLVVIFFAKKELFSFDFTKQILGKQPVVILVFALFALFNFGLSFYLKSQMTREAIDEQRPAALQNAAIIGYALCESISIFGVILAVGFDYAYFFAFFALSILGILLQFPKRDNFLAAVYKK